MPGQAAGERPSWTLLSLALPRIRGLRRVESGPLFSEQEAPLEEGVEQILESLHAERFPIGLEQCRGRLRQAEIGPQAIERANHVRGHVAATSGCLGLEKCHQLARHAESLNHLAM